MGVVTPEGKVKMFVRNYMRETFPGIFYYSPPGGAFGKAGMPDHLYLWRGILIAIEVKADKGVLSELQKNTLTALTNQGAICAVVFGKDIRKMEMIKNAINNRIEKLSSGAFRELFMANEESRTLPVRTPEKDDNILNSQQKVFHPERLGDW